MKKKFQVFNANSKGKLKAQDSICISNKKINCRVTIKIFSLCKQISSLDDKEKCLCRNECDAKQTETDGMLGMSLNL